MRSRRAPSAVAVAVAAVLTAVAAGAGAVLPAGQDAEGPWERIAAQARTDPAGAASSAVDRLEGDTGDLALADQIRAHELGLALIDAGRLDEAARVQVALHARVRAEWSAINAALTLGNLGRAEAADALLGAQLERTPRAAELWNRRGLVWLGAGETRLARRHLARAVRYGSEDAGLSLARLSLLAGDREAARAAFRPSVGGPAPHAWALRGWALTLLDEPRWVR